MKFNSVERICGCIIYSPLFRIDCWFHTIKHIITDYKQEIDNKHEVDNTWW